jgi:serine-type D-Ala-D-Ala carboxypeptidase/endopeptidase (penicillin-binding protein 4)
MSMRTTCSRTAAVTVGVVLAFRGLAAPAAVRQGTDPEQALRSTLAAEMAQGPAEEGAYVVDLSNGHVVFADRAGTPRRTASVMKLYTTATALLGLGRRTRLSTRVLGTGHRAGTTWAGSLYLRGGGDFTFGSASFGRKAYGGGGSVEKLAADIRRRGLRRIRGSVFADNSLFTDNGGPLFKLVLCAKPLFGPHCPYGPAGRFERPIPNGPLTPIGFDRGLLNDTSARVQRRPGRFAAQGLIRALERRGVRVDGRADARPTPTRVRALAATRSPSIARLAALVNKPSDNYAADVMLRMVGARLGGQGSAAAGALAVGDAMRPWGLHPEINSGSGETVLDRSSPRDIVGLLRRMHRRPEGRAFERSLSLAGRNGTLARFAGTVVDGRCTLKDGTRVDEQPRTTLDIAGICHSVGGRSFAFVVMMNGMPLDFVPPDQLVSPAYALENAIVEALAGYSG